MSTDHFIGLVGTPHFFHVVEFTGFRPEDMDDDITGIHDDPVGAGDAFQTNVLDAFGGEFVFKPVGQSAHMS